ncbi:unnamed protein product [Prorocentrum cordatum]|uniref:Uncharacterized protein n=1 Tax=Prorocentrum cordatum TaxID=2364126 RepID=A0ABN9XR06_9DINO|nr:unnamed protein product [Polarella glacialis]
MRRGAGSVLRTSRKPSRALAAWRLAPEVWSRARWPWSSDPNGNGEMIYDSIIQNARGDGQLSEEVGEAVYEKIRERLKQFTTPGETQIGTRAEGNDLEKLPSESCLDFEARRERHRRSVQRAGLARAEAEDFAECVARNGKKCTAVTRVGKRDCPRKDSGIE